MKMIDFVLGLKTGDRFIYHESCINCGICEMVENRSNKENINVSIRIPAEFGNIHDINCGPSGAYLGITFLPIR